MGGIAVVFIFTYLVWRFCIKKRREEWHQRYWEDPAHNLEKENEEFGMQRDARASTHTVGSIASTVLTRASNIIQIAYIPGVTNRSIESSPDLLVPPVPPIPAMSPSRSAVTTPQPHQQDQHFFMPSDLRDSRFSEFSDDGRTSFARSSMTPSQMRSSVATNAYRGNAVINTAPAQTATRAKAIPISLRSNTTTGTTTPNNTATPRSTTPPVPGVNSPPVPPLNLQRNGSSHSPIVARLGIPRAVTVTRSQSNNTMSASNSLRGQSNPSPSNSEASQPVLVKPEKRVSIADSTRHNGDSSTFDDASSSSEDDSPADQSLMGHEKQLAAAKLGHSAFKTPASAPDLRYNKSPSSSPDSRGYAASESRQKRHKRSGSLNQIIEEATRRASREPRHGGLGSVGSLAHWKTQGGGPFSDAHAAGTP